MEKFKQLGIEQEIIESIQKQGFHQPTDIQEQTIPHIIKGEDVIAESATGSGKTLAFGAGIIQSITKGKGAQALILTPTRELAQQVSDEIKKFAYYKKLKVAVIYGGVSYTPQFESLKIADIIVGTPGRIYDHMQRKSIDLSKVKHLVLDEADRMLDMGFLDDVKRIISFCPKERQTLFFSATIPLEVAGLSKQFMKNPKKIRVGAYVDPKKLKQYYYDVTKDTKFSLLVHLLNDEASGLVMVFCNSRRAVDFVAKGLNKQNIEAEGIHGGLTQNRRSKIIEKFNSRKALILVCTDVAARGLDIPGVSHVYNYDLPNDARQYIHRIGRTARAGESGKAVNLLSYRDYDNFDRILRDNDCDIKKMEKPQFKKVNVPPPQRRTGRPGRGRPGQGGRGGPRTGNRHKRPRQNASR